MPGGSPEAWPLVKADLPGDRRQDVGRRALLRLGRRRRRRPLREDGPQRHRVRRHAAHLPRPTTSCRTALGLTARRDARGLHRVEQGRPGQLPDRDHPRHPGRHGRRDGQAAGRRDPRHGRPEGHRQVDRDQRARPGRPGDPDRRGRVRPLPVGASRTSASPPAKCSTGPTPQSRGDKKAFIEDIRQALTPPRSAPTPRASCCMRAAAKEYGWNLNFGGIALMWRGGCIIRSRVPGPDQGGLRPRPELANLLLDPLLQARVSSDCQAAWRRRGRRRPCSWASRSRPSAARSPTTTATAASACPPTCIQAQRDYFGAHTYERVDQAARRLLPHPVESSGGRT